MGDVLLVLVDVVGLGVSVVAAWVAVLVWLEQRRVEDEKYLTSQQRVEDVFCRWHYESLSPDMPLERDVVARERRHRRGIRRQERERRG